MGEAPGKAPQPDTDLHPDDNAADVAGLGWEYEPTPDDYAWYSTSAVRIYAEGVEHGNWCARHCRHGSGPCEDMKNPLRAWAPYQRGLEMGYALDIPNLVTLRFEAAAQAIVEWARRRSRP
jgi:hypothetical protein